MAISRKQVSQVGEQSVNGRSPPGVSLHELYTVNEAKARLGWTDSALRSAKRQGLKLLKCGKRRHVTGAEILRFLESVSVRENES